MRLRSAETLWKLSRRVHGAGFRRTARVLKTVNYLAHRALLRLPLPLRNNGLRRG